MQADKLADALTELRSHADRKEASAAELAEQKSRIAEAQHDSAMVVKHRPRRAAVTPLPDGNALKERLEGGEAAGGAGARGPPRAAGL